MYFLCSASRRLRACCRDKRNDVLGRYTLSADPCKLSPVDASKMFKSSSFEQLLERSAKAQADEVGHSLELSIDDNNENGDSSDDSDSGDDGAAEGADTGGADTSLTKKQMLESWGVEAADAGGQQNLLRALLAVFGEVSALRSRNLNQNSVTALRQGEDSNTIQSGLEILQYRALFSRTIDAEDFLSDKSESGWRTRPMIMHKVANPLHLHYLHWRLQHCAIPKADLMTPEAIANAQSYMPSARVIFHTIPTVPVPAKRPPGSMMQTGQNLLDDLNTV